MTSASLAFVALALVAGSASAANRCVDTKGRVTYQDAPCEGATPGRSVDTTEGFSTRPGRTATGIASPSATSTGPDPAYSTFRGAWRGPAQLKLTIGRERDDLPGVVPAVLEIKPDGEVAGFIGQGGCKVAGLATQFITPTVGSLGVTLSGCPDPRFNGRYSGQLGVFSSSKEATLTLTGLANLGTARLQQMRVDAVLKR